MIIFAYGNKYLDQLHFMWNKTNKRKGNASTALEDSINRKYFYEN